MKSHVMAVSKLIYRESVTIYNSFILTLNPMFINDWLYVDTVLVVLTMFSHYCFQDYYQ